MAEPKPAQDRPIPWEESQMHRLARASVAIALVGGFATYLAGAPVATAKELKVISEKTVTGFGHIESIAYDPRRKVFYASDFGPELKPPLKDGKGKLTTFSMDGKILKDGAITPPNNEMNKPKGIWIKGDRLWTTDIDAVWIFDLKTNKGKKLPLPGVAFANDVVLIGGALYVSDNRNDLMVKVEPADFLSAKSPKITTVYSGKGVFPNGLWAAPKGKLLIVGFQAKDKPQAIYEWEPGKDPVAISDKIGMLDGIYQLKNGDLLVTDWISGSLFQWNKTMGVHKLADGFKGPADFAVVPNKQGYLVAVADLVKGEARLVQLSK
jgi:hypothetical protein